MANDLEPTAFFARYFAGDQAVLADPYPTYHALRERGPVIRVDAGTGEPWDDAWHVFDYATAAALLTDRRMSSRRDLGGRRHDGRPPDGQAPPIPPMMLTMDPPDHTRLRRLVSAAFTPRVVERLRGDIETLIDDLLDEASATGDPFDLVRAVAYPLPTVVIARLLGLPEADWPAIKGWSEPGISFAQDERSVPNAIALGRYLAEAVARRRAAPVGNDAHDLIGALVAARDGGDVLSDAELVGQCQLLLVAGHETTSYAIASAVLTLLRTRGAWEGLPHRDPDHAADELLRFEAPFQAMTRRAAAAVEVAGAEIPAGDLVWLWIGAANRDPSRFADPDRLDLGRADNRHLSFGLGIHFCLGAALARLELAVALERLRQRFPRLRLIEDAVVWRDPAIRGPKSLPVAWR